MHSPHPQEPQTVGAFIKQSTDMLLAADIPTARLDTLVLLEDVLGSDRTLLLAHPEQTIDDNQLHTLQRMLQRRVTHEPLAYIRNTSEFYGRDFYVDHHVLEPRPESETMIDLLKALPLPEAPAIIDVGTGSGALAITARLELSQARVTGVDIDPECLKVASHNARILAANVHFIQSDLLTAVPEKTLERALLLCNLPYVPDTFQINPAAMQEPRLAIFGGPDGLDLYRKLFNQVRAVPQMPTYILTEALPPQHPELSHIANSAGFVLDRSEDFIQVFKIGSGNSAS